MISILIPARHELYLQETVDDILKKASGEIEIIVVLDGYWPKPILKDDKRVVLIHRERMGMRAAINGASSIAKGKYLLKMDGHCSPAPGFDEVLKADCDDNWIVVPRRYALDAETWSIKRNRSIIDYEYLCHPDSNKGRMHGKPWPDRAMQRADKLLDEAMTFQGSCWFMAAEHYKRLGGMNEEGYGTFVCEAQEIGLKTWLGGGKVLVNKKTWYAHLWKGQVYRDRFRALYGKQYTRIGFSEHKTGNAYSTDYWINNRWPERQHDFEWLLERFWPVPTWEKIE